MRKLILLFFVCIILESCNSNKLDGIYVFEKSEPQKSKKSVDFFDMSNAVESGRQMGCELIGQIEFKDGKCYYSGVGIDHRETYEIENGIIYLAENKLITFKIIDDYTIEYMGCNFIKSGASKTELK